MYEYKYKYKYESTYGMKPQRISRQEANVRFRNVFIRNDSTMDEIRGVVSYLMPDGQRYNVPGSFEKIKRGITWGYLIPDEASKVNVEVQYLHHPGDWWKQCFKEDVSFPFYWRVTGGKSTGVKCG
jgi:hypothetical protein